MRRTLNRYTMAFQMDGLQPTFTSWSDGVNVRSVLIWGRKRFTADTLLVGTSRSVSIISKVIISKVQLRQLNSLRKEFWRFLGAA